MPDPVSNFPYSLIQAGSGIIGSSSSGVTIILASGDGAAFPTASVDIEWNVVLWPAATSRPAASNAEIIRVVRSGDTLTVKARAQEGTAALSTWASGDQVAAAITAKTLTDPFDRTPTDDQYVLAGYSQIVASDIEIPSGYFFELASDGILEII